MSGWEADAAARVTAKEAELLSRLAARVRTDRVDVAELLQVSTAAAAAARLAGKQERREWATHACLPDACECMHTCTQPALIPRACSLWLCLQETANLDPFSWVHVQVGRGGTLSTLPSP